MNLEEALRKRTKQQKPLSQRVYFQLLKAGSHKYIKREGSKGRYKYTYKEAHPKQKVPEKVTPEDHWLMGKRYTEEEWNKRQERISIQRAGYEWADKYGYNMSKLYDRVRKGELKYSELAQAVKENRELKESSSIDVEIKGRGDKIHGVKRLV